MVNAKTQREFEMGLIGVNEYIRRLTTESRGGSPHARYEAGLITFEQLQKLTKKQRRKGAPNPNDPVLNRIGKVAGHNVVVPDSRLGGSNVQLRRVKDPQLDRATAHTDR
jgi:hypothetical protein